MANDVRPATSSSLRLARSPVTTLRLQTRAWAELAQMPPWSVRNALPRVVRECAGLAALRELPDPPRDHDPRRVTAVVGALDALTGLQVPVDAAGEEPAMAAIAAADAHAAAAAALAAERVLRGEPALDHGDEAPFASSLAAGGWLPFPFDLMAVGGDETSYLVASGGGSVRPFAPRGGAATHTSRDRALQLVGLALVSARADGAREHTATTVFDWLHRLRHRALHDGMVGFSTDVSDDDLREFAWNCCWVATALGAALLTASARRISAHDRAEVDEVVRSRRSTDLGRMVWLAASEADGR